MKDNLSTHIQKYVLMEKIEIVNYFFLIEWTIICHQWYLYLSKTKKSQTRAAFLRGLFGLFRKFVCIIT